MSRKIKIAGLAGILILFYYGLQYGASAVDYNCRIIRDDCVPPIRASAELIYRVMVKPIWLDQFEIRPTTFSFKDGRFNFWEGEVSGKADVIRVPENGSAVTQWIAAGLPLGIPIYPADGEHIAQWLKDHPEYQLSE